MHIDVCESLPSDWTSWNFNVKLSGAIPIYWGTSKCLDLFERDSFLFFEKDDNIGYFKLLNQIKELDQDDEKYLIMRSKKLINEQKIVKMQPYAIKNLLNI